MCSEDESLSFISAWCRFHRSSRFCLESLSVWQTAPVSTELVQGVAVCDTHRRTHAEVNTRLNTMQYNAHTWDSETAEAHEAGQHST